MARKWHGLDVLEKCFDFAQHDWNDLPPEMKRHFIDRPESKR